MTVEDACKGDIIGGEIEVAALHGEQHVLITVNGCVTSELALTEAGNIKFDGMVGDNGKLKIEINIPDSVSPSELGESDDTRDLGIAISRMIITEAE